MSMFVCVISTLCVYEHVCIWMHGLCRYACVRMGVRGFLYTSLDKYFKYLLKLSILTSTLTQVFQVP